MLLAIEQYIKSSGLIFFPTPHCQGLSPAPLTGPPASAQVPEAGHPPPQELTVSSSGEEVGGLVHTGSLAY